MTINEAIAHVKEVAEQNYLQGMLCHANPNDSELDRCIDCAREHEQLAEWLQTLKLYLEIGTLEEVKEAINAWNKSLRYQNECDKRNTVRIMHRAD